MEAMRNKSILVPVENGRNHYPLFGLQGQPWLSKSAHKNCNSEEPALKKEMPV